MLADWPTLNLVRPRPRVPLLAVLRRNLRRAVDIVPARFHPSGGRLAEWPRLTCASDDGRRHLCPIITQGGVRMVNQRSGSPCVQGSTWGFDGGGIWVDCGCRADFALNVRR